jgi:hypothetical protein
LPLHGEGDGRKVVGEEVSQRRSSPSESYTVSRSRAAAVNQPITFTMTPV